MTFASVSYVAIHSALEPRENTEVELVRKNLVAKLIRMQEISAVIFGIQLVRHGRICQPSIEVKHRVKGSRVADKVVDAIDCRYTLWLSVGSCGGIGRTDCERSANVRETD